MYYVDADFFLALVKEKDWMKEKAVAFARHNELFKTKTIFTSSYALLEVWFVLNRQNQFKREVFHAIGAIVDHIVEFGKDDLEFASVLQKEFNLNIGDSIHAAFALRQEGIISSDDAFDDVKGLKRINFLE